LAGYKTPGEIHHSVVSMFANDTTVYLSATDDIEILNTILSTWCCTSGAKFNMDKTEVIPISMPDYWQSLIASSKLNPTSSALPLSVRVAHNGQAIHILGAWLGNNVNKPSVWSSILKKIDSKLQKWNSWNPSIEGRKTIIQWTIGAMTQYLTCIQGMPKNIEIYLTKCLKLFTWDMQG
ncbi:hypothetical protein F5J12DRAFT_728988, partial [Pisolithus orientalis]|uniref:uncharacterized protein n=1 Tax=Pisolithus orientalis TaxID=936130 RepID=UPI0022244AE4